MNLNSQNIKRPNSSCKIEKLVMFLSAIILWSYLIPFGYDLFRMVLILLSIMIVMEGFYFKKKILPPLELTQFFFILALSIFWTLDIKLSLKTIAQLGVFFLYSIVLIRFANKRGDADFFVWYFVVLGINAILIVFFLLIAFGTLRGGNITFSNHLASACVLSLPFFIYLSFGKKKKKYSFLTLSCLLLFGLLLTGSRGAILTGFFGLFVFILFTFVSNFKKIIFVIKKAFVSIIAFIILGALIFSYGTERIPVEYLNKLYYRYQLLSLNVETRERYLKRHYERIVSFEDALSVIKSRPFFGVGYGAFFNFSRNEIFLVHNWLLSGWVSSGILGLMSIVFLFFISMKKGWSKSKKKIGGRSLELVFFISLCMAWFHGLFRPVNFNPSFYVLCVWSLFRNSQNTLIRKRNADIYFQP